MPIYFYTTGEAYGEFSNFSRHGFELDGHYWKTSEHYFQAMKFEGTPYYDKVREARTPKEAAKLGRRRDFPLRKDWEDVKDDVMRRAVLKKFQTHQSLKELLLSTGDEEIVENAPSDYYWGCGYDGSGKNMLGVILMEVRQQLAE
ncbi:MAG: NADAR family protein [Chloroflexota bacterium]